MSIDSCFDEDVGKVMVMLETALDNVGRALKQESPARATFKNAGEFIKQYNLCVRMGHSTEKFRELLNTYSTDFKYYAKGCAKYAGLLGVLGASGGLAYYAWPEMAPVALGAAAAFSFGAVFLGIDVFRSIHNVKFRQDMLRDNDVLNQALKKLQDNLLNETRRLKPVEYGGEA